MNENPNSDNSLNNGKVVYEIEGVIAIVKEGVLKKVDLRFDNGIEITHPDDTVEFLEGIKKLVATEVGDVYM